MTLYTQQHNNSAGPHLVTVAPSSPLQYPSPPITHVVVPDDAHNPKGQWSYFNFDHTMALHAAQTPICKCALQAPDFCPYCAFEQDILAECHTPSQPAPLPSPPVSTPDLIYSPPLQFQPLTSAVESPTWASTLSPGATSDATYFSGASSSAHHSAPSRIETPPHDLNEPPTTPAPPRRKLEKRTRPVSHALSDDESLQPRGAQGKIKVVKSNSFLRTISLRSPGPRPRAISECIQTEDLVSLAFTGESLAVGASPAQNSPRYNPQPIPSSSSLPLPPAYSPHPSPSRPAAVTRRISEPLLHSTPSPEPRRAVLRKPPDSNTPSPNTRRPWSLAMTITDDAVTDEALVHELEQMRIKHAPIPEEPEDFELPLGLCPLPVPLHEITIPSHHTPHNALFHNHNHAAMAEDDLAPLLNLDADISPTNQKWHSARKALLLCREFVRTERRFLSAMATLIAGATRTPPPTSMLPYLPGIIHASEDFLRRLEENPSVQGVAEAFLGCYEKLRAAFVVWSGVVGEFFGVGGVPLTNGSVQTQRLGLVPTQSHSDSNSTSDALSDAMSATTSVNGNNGRGKRLRKNSTARSLANSKKQSSSSPSPLAVANGGVVVIPQPNKIKRKSRSTPTVQDLAIMPTQRVVRYVLLFKELCSLTPYDMPSFPLVRQAMLQSQELADSCNRAQSAVIFDPFTAGQS